MAHPTPPFVVHAQDVEEHEGRYPEPFDGEGLAFGRNLAAAAGARSLGAWLDRLPPGRRTSFPHAHLHEEEAIYVVDGTPHLRWLMPGEPAQECALRPGSYVSFPAGTGVAHTIINRSKNDAVLLVLGERRVSDRIAYPENPDLEGWRREHRPHRQWNDRLGPTGTARAPAYWVECPRLILRPWEMSDVPTLVALMQSNHDHLKAWMPWAQKVPTVDNQLAWVMWSRSQFDRQIEYHYGMFRHDGAPIGAISLNRTSNARAFELGYWIDLDHQGQGLVSEAAAALCRVATEILDAERVSISHDPDNVRSAAVPQRLGFQKEGVLRAWASGIDGRLRDTAVWTWLAQDASRPIRDCRVKAYDGLGRRLL